MSEFLKPQSPLQYKDGAYVYPLTTVDQVIMADGSRLKEAGSSLGLVKSGGDVTISDGVIQVNSVAWNNISGKPGSFTPSEHTHNYLPLTGGTISGSISTETAGVRMLRLNGVYQEDIGNMWSSAAIEIRENGLVGATQEDIRHAPALAFHWSGRCANTLNLGADGVLYLYNNTGNLGYFKAGTVYGAVWNDYAEYRSQKEDIKPGYCVTSADNGQVYKTTEKFQACDGIVSDTFGFAIGETDECKTPLAVAGRVLAYCEGDKHDYHSGDTVCAGPNGKVVKMTREEIREWPDRIVGVVSEIPEYDTWGSGNVKVDGRIWIKVK